MCSALKVFRTQPLVTKHLPSVCQAYHTETNGSISGQYYERIWNKTVASAYVGSASEFEEVCKGHFKNGRRMCLGLFQDKSEVAALGFLMSQTPLPRKLSKSCSGFLGLEGSGACEECQKLNDIPEQNSIEDAAENSKSLDVNLKVSKRRKKAKICTGTTPDKDYADSEQDCQDGDLDHDMWLNKAIGKDVTYSNEVAQEGQRRLDARDSSIDLEHAAEEQMLKMRQQVSDCLEDDSMNHDLWLNQAIQPWGRSTTGKPVKVRVHGEYNGKRLVKVVGGGRGGSSSVQTETEGLNAEEYSVITGERSTSAEISSVLVAVSDPPKVPEIDYRNLEFECKYCLRKCATREVLLSHLSKAHDFCKDTFRCPICYQKAASVADLVRHMKADILFLNHDSRILRPSYNPRCAQCS